MSSIDQTFAVFFALKEFEMKTVFLLALIVNILLLCLPLRTQAQLEITLKHNDQREQQTEAQLRRLLQQHDLSGWYYTKKVVIESGYNVIPHSHPVLTLSTRHLKVEPTDAGCRLRVVQDGFPCEAIADDFYAACNVGWRNRFAGIRQYLAAIA